MLQMNMTNPAMKSLFFPSIFDFLHTGSYKNGEFQWSKTKNLNSEYTFTDIDFW